MYYIPHDTQDIIYNYIYYICLCMIHVYIHVYHIYKKVKREEKPLNTAQCVWGFNFQIFLFRNWCPP